MTAPASYAGSRRDVPNHYTANYLKGQAEHPRLARCRSAVHPGGALPYVGHYTAQNCNFALDLFDDPELAGRLPMPAEDLRRAILDIGDELVYRLTDFDQRLAVARSGALIRTVYQTAGGAVYCNSVVPGEYLVAVVLSTQAEGDDPLSERGTIRRADQALARLVTDLRADLSRGDQNPGGWREWERRRTGPPVGGEPPVAHRGVEIGPVPDACRAALDVEHLHYVGWVRNRDVVFAADVLDAPALRRFFPDIAITPTLRREFYGRLARLLSRLYPELTGLVEPVAGDPLHRLVLDVEEGAVYWYRQAPGTFLIGVTLNQDRVSRADDAMAELTVHVQKQDKLSTEFPLGG
jgi:hypothetical protein